MAALNPTPAGDDIVHLISDDDGAVAAAPATGFTTALASGLASNAFGSPDSHGVVPLSPPPPGVFESWEALKDSAQQHAKLAGYALVQGKGSEKRNNRWIRFLICKHGSVYDSRGLDENHRQRKNRTTKKTNCKAKLKAKERPDGSWTLKPMYEEHNHPANAPVSCHEHRQLSEDQLKLVMANQTAGITANRTKRSLKAIDPDIEIISRDIYNQTARIGRELRRGKPPNEALIEKLSDAKAKGELFFEYSLTPEGRISKLFVADKNK